MKKVNRTIWSVSLIFFMMSGWSAMAQNAKQDVKQPAKQPVKQEVKQDAKKQPVKQEAKPNAKQEAKQPVKQDAKKQPAKQEAKPNANAKQEVKQDAKQEEKQEVKKPGKSPEIVFDYLVYDYGTIFENDPGECEFKFKNTGKEPLVLSNVYSSCGCTVPDWPKDPIMPGKTSSIKVRYATSRIGGINKTITVISNAEVNSKVELRITGNVKKKEEAEYPEKQPNTMQATPTK